MSSHMSTQHSDTAHPQAKAPSISTFYSCAVCEDILLRHAELYKHLEADHGILGPAFCATCENIFFDKAELARHTETNHTISQANYSEGSTDVS